MQKNAVDTRVGDSYWLFLHFQWQAVPVTNEPLQASRQLLFAEKPPAVLATIS